MRILKIAASVVLGSLSISAMDNPHGSEITINEKLALEGTSQSFFFRSISTEEGASDPQDIAALVSECTFKEGLPQNPTSWANNLTARQKLPNPYSALLIFPRDHSVETKPIACLGLGMMGVDGYSPENTDIIDTYVSLGVIKFKDSDLLDEPKYSNNNIERVCNYSVPMGLATLLPILPDSLSRNQVIEMLGVGASAIQFLRNKGHLLPRGDNSLPSHIFYYFRGEEPLIKEGLLAQAGFKVVTKPGFSQRSPEELMPFEKNPGYFVGTTHVAFKELV